jgi:hypothetical protein
MSVEALPEVRLHPAEEVLEEYCLGRVKDPILSRVEEHLLVCPACCARLADLDIYLAVMKAGLAGIEEQAGIVAPGSPDPAASHSTSVRQTRRPAPVTVPLPSTDSPLESLFPAIPGGTFLRIAALVVFVVSAAIVWRAQHTTSGSPSNAARESEVSLVALRGSAADEMPRAQAGIPLHLNFDRSSLPEAPAYRVEVVDATGRQAWSGRAAVSGDRLSVHVSQNLASGVYWVRLYSGLEAPRESQLLREFGLRLE